MEVSGSRPHARDLRKGRVSEAGRVYLITAVTRGRRPLFSDLYVARHVVVALRKEASSGRARTLAFVVMPDHLHWLLQLGAGASLPVVVGAVKSVTAHRIGGPVWQAGFHDHAVRGEENVPAIARYIIANPLRAGLARRVADYSHWDAAWL